MCSMPPTVAATACPVRVTIRCSISSGDSPEKVQITVMTGSGMTGNTFTGVDTMDTRPPIRMRMATQTKVYGRRSAIRTNHIIDRSSSSQASPEQRLECGAGAPVGESRAHETELRLDAALLRREEGEDRGDPGVVPQPEAPQILGGEPHRLVRQFDVVLGDVQVA